MFAHLTHTQLLRYAGLFTWACVGIPLVLNSWYYHDGLSRADLIAWRIVYVVFGAGYWVLTRRLGHGRYRPMDIALLAVITTCAIAVSHFSNSGLGGGLLLVIAGILPWVLGLRVGLIWLVVQHLALVPVFSGRADFSLVEAFLQALFYVGYSTVAFVTGLVALQQTQAREEQRRLISELHATRALLAESTRLNERVRISRELHDLLGHHLTALSLNLEVATHLVEGKAQEHVQQAKFLAKLLLTDVREAVSQLRDGAAIDLREALEALIEGVPSLRIHLDMPESLVLSDPLRAQVVLRCAQEVITNAVRHAEADNLWIRLVRDVDAVVMQAHDDGRGGDVAAFGNGLRGMRERLAEYGGRLTVGAHTHRGFALDAHLPLENSP